MKLVHKLSILASLFAFAGCASHLSKDQCQSMNWQQVGYQHGERGEFRSSLEKEQKDCARFSMSVDNQSYNKGWEHGVRAFCQPARARELGIQGKEFNPVCPQDLLRSFEHAWHDGLREFCIPGTGYRLGREGAKLPNFCSQEQAVEFTNAYHDGHRQFQRISRLKSELHAIQSDIDRKEREIRDSRSEIEHLNHKISDARANREDRFSVDSYRRRIDEHHRRIRDNRHDLTRLSIQLMAAQSQLNNAESQG